MYVVEDKLPLIKMRRFVHMRWLLSTNKSMTLIYFGYWFRSRILVNVLFSSFLNQKHINIWNEKPKPKTWTRNPSTRLLVSDARFARIQLNWYKGWAGRAFLNNAKCALRALILICRQLIRTRFARISLSERELRASRAYSDFSAKGALRAHFPVQTWSQKPSWLLERN